MTLLLLLACSSGDTDPPVADVTCPASPKLDEKAPSVISIEVGGKIVTEAHAPEGGVERGGAILPLCGYAPLLQGDILFTGPTTSVVVQGDGAGVDILPNTRMAFGPQEPSQGGVRWWRDEQRAYTGWWLEGAQFPGGPAVAPQGTEVVMRVDADGTRSLTVLDGSVDLVPVGASRFRVEAGDEASFTGSSPSADVVARLDPERVASLSQEYDGLQRRLLGDSALFTVPDLQGKTVEEARAWLAEKGFTRVRAFPVEVAGVPEGQVVEQFPAAGALVRMGGAISLHVATAPASADTDPPLTIAPIDHVDETPDTYTLPTRYVTVPALRGMAEGAAKDELKRQGFPLGEVTRAAATLALGDEALRALYAAPAGEGIVYRQNPKGSATVSPKTEVSLWVIGPEVEVPSLKGKSVDDAKMDAARLGLSIEVASERLCALGSQVTTQSPRAGTTGNRGDTIKVCLTR